jgi:hypothetical protein
MRGDGGSERHLAGGLGYEATSILAQPDLID